MGTRTVLLVEDDDDIRNTLQEVLELEGYSVVPASNGQQALDTLAKIKKPSLILLDLMMPVMTGWEFLEVKQKDINVSDVPVIVFSAAGDRAKIENIKAFVKKPIEVDTLLNLIELHALHA
ncbi:MAG: response regulator [Oligoflexia bacterium]|nr:response regulator [Oligoflexia bacterium]